MDKKTGLTRVQDIVTQFRETKDSDQMHKNVDSLVKDIVDSDLSFEDGFLILHAMGRHFTLPIRFADIPNMTAFAKKFPDTAKNLCGNVELFDRVKKEIKDFYGENA